MDIYSTTLLVAMLVAAVAVLGAVAVWFRGDGVRFRRTARTAGVLSALLAVFALSYHLVAGHTPGTAEALGPIDFLLEHPAPLVTFLAGVATIWLAHRYSREA